MPMHTKEANGGSDKRSNCVEVVLGIEEVEKHRVCTI